MPPKTGREMGICLIHLVMSQDMRRLVWLLDRCAPA
jgi:hypothetical protein